MICNKRGVFFFLRREKAKLSQQINPPLLLLPVLPSYSRVRITGGFPSHS